MSFTREDGVGVLNFTAHKQRKAAICVPCSKTCTKSKQTAVLATKPANYIPSQFHSRAMLHNEIVAYLHAPSLLLRTDSKISTLSFHRLQNSSNCTLQSLGGMACRVHRSISSPHCRMTSSLLIQEFSQ